MISGYVFFQIFEAEKINCGSKQQSNFLKDVPKYKYFSVIINQHHVTGGLNNQYHVTGGLSDQYHVTGGINDQYHMTDRWT
jgi:hypothetical protein